MKKFRLVLIGLILVLFIINMGNTKNVYAGENGPEININVEGGENGEFKAGSDVTIKIDISDLSNLYAASFNYTYDNTLIKIDSVDVNNDIQSAGVYEPYKDTAKDGNKARYCFTLIGDNPGLSGNYNFVTMKGKALKDGQIKVDADNINFQLVNKNGDNMEKGNYTFKTSKGDVYKVTNVTEENKELGGSPALSSKNKEKSEMKVELIKKSDEAEKRNENNRDVEDKGNKDVDNTTDEENNIESNSRDNEDSREENNSETEDLDENTSKPKSNLAIILGITVGIVLGAIITIIYKKKSN